jgi:predicted transcriptional regulator
MNQAKDVEVKARVTSSVRARLESIAKKRGEARSLILREAITEYLERLAEEAPKYKTRRKR